MPAGKTGREITMSTITVTVTGIIAPAIIGPSYTTTYGIDFGGFFGPAGGNLAGDPFTVVWTGANDCNCAGTANSFNPVIDAVLTINGHSYDFGTGMLPGLFGFNDFYNQVHQVEIGHLESFNGGLYLWVDHRWFADDSVCRIWRDPGRGAGARRVLSAIGQQYRPHGQAF